MTLLIFLAAAARARIVAADLRLVAPHGLHGRIVAPDARRSGGARGKTSGPRRQEAGGGCGGRGANAPAGSAFGSFSVIGCATRRGGRAGASSLTTTELADP